MLREHCVKVPKLQSVGQLPKKVKKFSNLAFAGVTLAIANIAVMSSTSKPASAQFVQPCGFYQPCVRPFQIIYTGSGCNNFVSGYGSRTNCLRSVNNYGGYGYYSGNNGNYGYYNGNAVNRYGYSSSYGSSYGNNCVGNCNNSTNNSYIQYGGQRW